MYSSCAKGSEGTTRMLWWRSRSRSMRFVPGESTPPKRKRCKSPSLTAGTRQPWSTRTLRRRAMVRPGPVSRSGHSNGKYVRSHASTKGVQSFRSILELAHSGTFQELSPKPLNRYVQELAGRHNIRNTRHARPDSECCRPAGRREPSLPQPHRELDPYLWVAVPAAAARLLPAPQAWRRQDLAWGQSSTGFAILEPLLSAQLPPSGIPSCLSASPTCGHPSGVQSSFRTSRHDERLTAGQRL